MGIMQNFVRRKLEKNLANEPFYFADMEHAKGGGYYLVELGGKSAEHGAVSHSYFRRKKGDKEISRTRIIKGIVDKSIEDNLDMEKIMISKPLLYALLSGMSEQEIEKTFNFKNKDGKKFCLDFGASTCGVYAYNGEVRDVVFADKLVSLLS